MIECVVPLPGKIVIVCTPTPLGFQIWLITHVLESYKNFGFERPLPFGISSNIPWKGSIRFFLELQHVYMYMHM